MNNGIQIIYPRTEYATLNQEIFSVLEKEIFRFMNMAKEPIQENFTYTLDVSHDEYSYQNYLSVVLYVSSYTGGAHPSHSILSIVYDKNLDRIVTMEDLFLEREDLLSILSRESRRVLSKNLGVVDQNMMLEGTKPILSNFSIFVFAPTGIMVFFPEYQVAPYSSGAFKVVVPYREIFHNKKD